MNVQRLLEIATNPRQFHVKKQDVSTVSKILIELEYRLCIDPADLEIYDGIDRWVIGDGVEEFEAYFFVEDEKTAIDAANKLRESHGLSIIPYEVYCISNDAYSTHSHGELEVHIDDFKNQSA